jgi:hypothetical protein
MANQFPDQGMFNFALDNPISFIDFEGSSGELPDPPTKTTSRFVKVTVRTSAPIQQLKPAQPPSKFITYASRAFQLFGNVVGSSNVLSHLLRPANADYRGPGADGKSELYYLNSPDRPLERVTNNPDADLSYEEKKALRDRVYYGTASESDKLQFAIIMRQFAGSGPTSGVLSLSNDSESGKAVANYYPRTGYIEFVFDSEKEVFAVGKANDRNVLGFGFLSPHEQLNKLIEGDYQNVIGGMFSREKDGSITVNDYSGHFYQNWTMEKANKLKAFLEKKTGKKVNIIFVVKPPSK